MNKLPTLNWLADNFIKCSAKSLEVPGFTRRQTSTLEG